MANPKGSPSTGRRLGRGLSSLISMAAIEDEVAAIAGSAGAQPGSVGVMIVKVSQIRPNPYQPRHEVPPESLKALADSIAKTGLIQPIVVRSAGPDIYELVVGERRWRAAQMAGVGEIPVIVREATSEQMLEIALVENIYREDLNAIDRAKAYKRYHDEFGLGADQIASRLGEDRSTVSNYLRMLDLPIEIQGMVANGSISMGHARALLGLRSPDAMLKLADQVIGTGLSVRETEKAVRQRLAARASAVADPAGKQAKRPLVRELEQAFVRSLGTKVEIFESRRKGKGRIVIHYADLACFDGICERLGISTEGV